MIRAALQRRYERDPAFFNSLQKLARMVTDQAQAEQRPIEKVFDANLQTFQEKQHLSDLLVQEQRQQQILYDQQVRASQVLLNSIAEEPIHSVSKNGKWESTSECDQTAG